MTALPRVLLTRPHSQARPDRFGAALEALGYEVVPAPLTRTRIDSAAIHRSLVALRAAASPSRSGAEAAWILLTSARAVQVLASAEPRLAQILTAARARGARIGAVGPATARALEALGVEVDLLGPGDGLGLAESIGAPGTGDGATETPMRGGEDPEAPASSIAPAHGPSSAPAPRDAAPPLTGRPDAETDARSTSALVLWPRSGSAAPALVDRLTAAGWTVAEEAVYDTAPIALEEVPAHLADLWTSPDLAAALVTAPSALETLIALLGAPDPATPLLVLGAPSAAACARLAPRNPVLVADTPTPEGAARLLATRKELP